MPCKAPQNPPHSSEMGARERHRNFHLSSPYAIWNERLIVRDPLPVQTVTPGWVGAPKCVPQQYREPQATSIQKKYQIIAIITQHMQDKLIRILPAAV
jgi:hypothetical protein